MITTASNADVLAAIGRARSVLFSAYVLRPGALLDTLEAAARRGAQVTVRLEGRPYAGGDTPAAADMAADNRSAVERLRKAGGNASMADTTDRDGPPLHLKAAVCDGAVYLDDRNWPGDGADTIVRDDFPDDVAAVRAAVLHRSAPLPRWFWTNKAGALAAETRLLYGAQRAHYVDVESELFGRDGAYGALKRLAAAGVRCRLLVSQRDLNPKSQAAIQELKREGVRVRVGDFDEKMAIVDEERAWIGSANATLGARNQIDWGLRTDAPQVVSALEDHFNAHWAAAARFKERTTLSS
jgi:phosphatidylserine/phosphatidylglycerophosphate/cardiolipin synthase-like enzyme